MNGRRHNQTGRSTGKFANTKFRKSNSPPPDTPWFWITLPMLQSPAWRAMSGGAIKIISRVAIEHMAHGGGQNGLLAVTYSDFEQFGVRRSSILPYLVEVMELGWIARTQKGVQAWGDFEGAPALYRLTFLPTCDGRPATDAWKRFTSLKEAQAAAKRARQFLETERKRIKATKVVTGARPFAAAAE